MKREGRARLHHRNAMTTLLLLTSTNPVFDQVRVARIGARITGGELIDAADVIKRGAKLTDITVDGTGGQMFRADAIELARKPEMRTRENMDDSPATRIAITQETQDVSGCS